MRAIPCPVSVEELRHLYLDQKLTDEEIASRLPGGTGKRVQAWRCRYGIETLPRWARNNVPPIEGRLRSVLVGSMLGDGRVVFQGTVSHYCESHCGEQRAYLEWKVAEWGERWVASVDDIPDKRGYEQVRMRTVAHEALNEWRDLFYEARDKGWKRLVPKVVDMVDELALAVWYMDDGHAGWWPGITFGAGDASREVALAIFEKFGLQPRWQLKQRATGEFHMEREDTAERFIDLVAPHVPPCMAHKLSFGFQGPHYQVRQKLRGSDLQGLVEAGLSARRIAQAVGVGATTLGRHLERVGLQADGGPDPFKTGSVGRDLYAAMHPDHPWDGTGFADAEGRRVEVRTSNLRARSDIPGARRWSFYVRETGQVGHRCDAYACLCLDEEGTVLHEFGIPAEAVGDRVVVRIPEDPVGSPWTPYLRPSPQVADGGILDLFG